MESKFKNLRFIDFEALTSEDLVKIQGGTGTPDHGTGGGTGTNGGGKPHIDD